MAADAKSTLSKTIRALRKRLLRDLHDETEAAYRLSIPARDAKLDEATRVRRGRLESWITEQLRAQDGDGTKSKEKRTAEDFRRDAEKQAAYTLLNRLVILRLMEAPEPSGKPLREPPIATGGWESQGYMHFRQLAPALVRGDETEGYAYLLGLAFEDLATELPGVFGSGSIADLIPVSAATLRYAIEELDRSALETCWTDDMTLGWVYQYWNDPEREALDAKLNVGGKVAPHEIASKTQMFTERYMVDWLLQNSLGPMWLAMCKKHGWKPEVEADGTLAALETRRREWRAKREAGEGELTDLMPLHTEAERLWAYYVPQPIPDDAVEQAPASVRDLKILDPAVGSGHFLVVALDLLVPLYREEARHRGENIQPQWTDGAIVERILSHNLHGIDLDPRAVQIAAAALWLKARQVAPDAKPERLNLVASNLKLASLSDDDPALSELRREVEKETGVPAELTDTIMHALRGADHLGSLLKVDKTVEDALSKHETELGRALAQQGHLFEGFEEKQQRLPIDRSEARTGLHDRLERFLAKHASGDDLGLRLRGEQLAAGVRFVRMLREGSYDLVVANPPYQGTSKIADAKYVEKTYPLGKADLYAAFLLRGLELAKEGGVSAMLTKRNWMFIRQYTVLREHLLATHGLRALGDFDRGAFEDVPDEVVSVAVSAFASGAPTTDSVTLCPTPREDKTRDAQRTHRKRAATLCQVGRHEFDLAALKVIPDWPLVYWWTPSELISYVSMPKLGSEGTVAQGISTANDPRFFLRPWEVSLLAFHRVGGTTRPGGHMRDLNYAPLIKGADGKGWFEPLDFLCRWRNQALAIRLVNGSAFRSPGTHFSPGVAYVALGASFRARAHRYHSVCQNMGTSVFGLPVAEVVCALNSKKIAEVAQSLNPSLHFEVGDAKRLPLVPIEGAETIFHTLQSAFSIREAHREPSVEFLHPGSSPWRRAQAWAQVAVDRPEGASLPEYVEEFDTEPVTDHLSFSLGVALGRFGPAKKGILDPCSVDPSHALPGGILFLDTTLEPDDYRDSLSSPATTPIHESWATAGPAIDTKRSLREWLAVDFFNAVHKGMYEKRPIHWPLSSEKRTFVAWLNIHRFDESTLRMLLADHLQPAFKRLEGELTDLRAARDGADKKAARNANKRYDMVLKARDELTTFIADVEQCADRGPRPTDAKCPAREQDARYAPDLDDGVMINSAALWKLLEPQWKEPKKWWKELATAKGKKDYDWSHLAMRYWPVRVDKKCKDDPSLAVAHGCFWRYHPERAWAWELRLQDEIGPDFRVTEDPYRPGGRDLDDGGDSLHRKAWLRDHAAEALAAVEKEAVRRMRRGKDRKVVPEIRMIEPGLWSALPDGVWAMELRLSEKQGLEFRLRSPDEAGARTTFEAKHPALVKAREQLIKGLTPPPELFEDAEPNSDDELDAVDEDDEELDMAAQDAE